MHYTIDVIAPSRTSLAELSFFLLSERTKDVQLAIAFFISVDFTKQHGDQTFLFIVLYKVYILYVRF